MLLSPIDLTGTNQQISRLCISAMAAPHRRLTMLHLLLLSSLLCLQARAESTGMVFFLDSPARQFLRSRSSNDAIGDGLIQLPEVGAAVSILLGYAPSVALTASGSSKLNEVLSPNPFDRPRAVFMLEVSGVEDSKFVFDKENELFINALKSRVNLGLSRTEIELPDEDEISVVSLNELLNLGSQADCTDKEISNLASWLGGSYAVNDMDQLNGELTIPLSTGASLDLHLSERADREFTTGLVSLIHNVRRAMEMHEDLSQSQKSPAELLTGSFNGIKALQEKHGLNGVADQGMTLLFTVLSKIFDSLQTAYKGEIVGVIICSTTPHQESEKMLNVLFTSQPSARWLREKTSKASIIIVQALLVRNILAWVTGILLLIATLLGVYFLLNMQLTRDTLLYSNVKLD